MHQGFPQLVDIPEVVLGTGILQVLLLQGMCIYVQKLLEMPSGVNMISWEVSCMVYLCGKSMKAHGRFPANYV